MGHPIHSHTCTYLQQINIVEFPLTEIPYIRFSLNCPAIYMIPIQVWQYQINIMVFLDIMSCTMVCTDISEAYEASTFQTERNISAYLPPV
jgi:hypothetical protein